MQSHFTEQPPQGRRGERYVFLEAGAMAQNITLQAQALGLGAVIVGGFDDSRVSALLQFKAPQQPVLMLCLGLPA